MTVIRKASLDAHAAARKAKEADAIAAARAAGRAVGTVHVTTHSLGAAVYTMRATALHYPKDGLDKERTWQLRCLIKYYKEKSR